MPNPTAQRGGALEASGKTARELYQELKARPGRKPFGFGARAALVNVDLQCAYTQPETYPTAYETDPDQCLHVNALAAACRSLGLPVIWTYVAYLPSGEDCGVWGTRNDTPDSLQNIKANTPRATLDPRLQVEPSDVIMLKRMASAFFETNLASLLVWHRIDTIIVTGGSTSGCVRATAVDSLSHGYRTIVPEECVSDRHESPHFASLYDMAVKYADVMSVKDVLTKLK